MATWRIDINISQNISTADIDAFRFFRDMLNDEGPRSTLNERIFIDRRLAQEFADQFLQWILTQRHIPTPNNHGSFTINGTNVKSGTDGKLVAPSEFRSNAVTLANVDVGRVIRIPGGQGVGKNQARGHYLITARNGPNSVTVDGIVPVNATGLIFEVNEPAEVLSTLISEP